MSTNDFGESRIARTMSELRDALVARREGTPVNNEQAILDEAYAWIGYMVGQEVAESRGWL